MESKLLRIRIDTVGEVNEEGWRTYPKRKIRIKKMREKAEPIQHDPYWHYCKDCGIYPEFSKVVLISIMLEDGKITTLTGSEVEILEKLNQILEKGGTYNLSGWSAFSYTIPYLRKRMIINGIKPHRKLCIQNDKPWETTVIDLMNMWKHTSFTCSLELLCATLLGEIGDFTDEDGLVNNQLYTMDGGLQTMVERSEKILKMTARCYDAIINPQPRTIESLEPADNSPSQEGMINNPNKPEFTAGDLLKEKSKGKEIVEKWEMAEQYIDDLEHHYKISEELKSQIYALYESEQKKYNPTENTDDLPL